MAEVPAPSPEPLTDAYSHVGRPRYGSPASSWAALTVAGVQRAVFVLGPGSPAVAKVRELHATHGDRVRTIGIPWGG